MLTIRVKTPGWVSPLFLTDLVRNVRMTVGGLVYKHIYTCQPFGPGSASGCLQIIVTLITR